MSPNDIFDLIGKTNKISIIFFVITLVLLGYEFLLYIKDKKSNRKPKLPFFKKGGLGAPGQAKAPEGLGSLGMPQGAKPAPAAPIPPLISQMSGPSAKHLPPLKNKKKVTRGAKVTIGATAALMVLTIGIAWRLNQPGTQQAGLDSPNARAADGFITPGADVLPPGGSPSALTAVTPTVAIGNRALIPTITPRLISPTPVNQIDLSGGGALSPTPSFTGTSLATQEGTLSSTTSASTDETESSSGAEIVELPITGGSESATLAPTLPVAGTIQYSIGLLVIASMIVVASLIF